MVSEAKLTWGERCERDRQRRIKIALERGDSEAAEFFRTMDYGTEADHADDEEEIRLSNEAAAATPDWRNQRDFNDELDEMYPEDARLFNQLDELFPDWGRTHRSPARATPPGAGIPAPPRSRVARSRQILSRVAR